MVMPQMVFTEHNQTENLVYVLLTDTLFMAVDQFDGHLYECMFKPVHSALRHPKSLTKGHWNSMCKM